MKRSAEYWLKLLLRVCGILNVLAVVGVLMPQPWLAWCVGKVDPAVPVGLLVSHLARLVSGHYVFMGVMLLIFATDVRRYRTPITVAMGWIVFFGLATLIPGAKYIPAVSHHWYFWFLVGDGILGLMTVLAVLLLQSRIPFEKSETTRPGFDQTSRYPIPLRFLVMSLLALCGWLTIVVAVTVYLAREEFPTWFCPVFLAGTTLLLAVIGLYTTALWRARCVENPGPRSRAWLWLFLIASVLCTSSLHGFYPFRLDVAEVWSRFSPDLKFIKYNYALTAASLLAVIGLTIAFFRGHRRPASIGLLVLAGIMLIPNDDCGNPLNAPWIAWVGASPLMFMCNSVVLAIGYCALRGLWPRKSMVVMAGINIGVLLLGMAHSAEKVWRSSEAYQASLQRKFERERQRPPATVSRLPLEGHASFYLCSDASLGFKEGLPVIICIGHAFQQPETLCQFIGQFREPVLLIWSDLLADLSADTRLDDGAVWERKRQEFASVLVRYRELLHFDERRVYLTGFSFAGAYAWMLAYDRPGLYAGVVAMSATSSPEPIQQRLDSGRSMVTVVVRGEKDPWFQKHSDQEKQTGQAIEARNPHSKFVLKSGEVHRETAKHWVESLRYILQFRNEASHGAGAPHVPSEIPRSGLGP